jgi:antitoxin (DNA-binding transcriptional repressor) of toxin-antitoxin stability system
VIAKAGQPGARLVPERRRRQPRQPGTGKGQIVIRNSFYEDRDRVSGPVESTARLTT